LEKVCNAIGLPPVLCVFLVLGVLVGLLGIARTIDGANDGRSGVENAIAVR